MIPSPSPIPASESSLAFQIKQHLLAAHSFKAENSFLSIVIMTPIAMMLALGLVVIANAQDQCVAVAKSVPLCAVSHLDSCSPLWTEQLTRITGVRITICRSRCGLWPY